ncbi:hypothetical protein RI367_004995 [Sorochytrium milnesiophthora]
MTVARPAAEHTVSPLDKSVQLSYPHSWQRWFHVNFYAEAQPAERLVLSNWLSPQALFAVRICLALWTTVWIIIELFVVNEVGILIVMWFTILSYIGLWMLSMMLLYLSFRFRHDPHSAVLRQSRWTRVFANALYAEAFSYHIIVPAVFWAILAPAKGATMNLNPGSSLAAFDNMVMHGLDFVVVFIHFMTGAATMPLRMMVWQLGTALLYMFWTWIWHAAGDGWPYSFLDFDNPQSKIMYPGLLVAFTLVYLLGLGLHKLRDRITGDRITADRLASSATGLTHNSSA